MKAGLLLSRIRKSRLKLLPEPLFSPDLVIRNFLLFPLLKEQIKRTQKAIKKKKGINFETWGPLLYCIRESRLELFPELILSPDLVICDFLIFLFFKELLPGYKFEDNKKAMGSVKAFSDKEEIRSSNGFNVSGKTIN